LPWASFKYPKIVLGTLLRGNGRQSRDHDAERAAIDEPALRVEHDRLRARIERVGRAANCGDEFTKPNFTSRGM
jgi:hypothetical protein